MSNVSSLNPAQLGEYAARNDNRKFKLMNSIEDITGLMMHELLGEDRFQELMNKRDALIINTLTSMLDEIRG